MKIDEENVIQQLKARNEQALRFIIKQYGGLITSIMQRHLYNGSRTKKNAWMMCC
ncbi:DNA replication protein [Planococcus faecalis]|uniref:DNA replication protein n=1 Tax=Planococcus faecalis TaxID=1598147 RepID=UPI00210D164C|nr:DNA replication protein [Planococcus faecalis]